MSPPVSNATPPNVNTMAPEVTSALPELSAAERLAASREQLRIAMLPTRPVRRVRNATSADTNSAAEFEAEDDNAALGWRERVLATPGVALLIDVVETWWARHPMRTAAIVAGEASTALVRPMANRNPFRLVLVAFVVGAILSKARPWRWLLRRTLFAGLLPQIALRVASELPVQKWLAKINRP